MESFILIPIMISLGFFALVFGIVYMNKKENLAMIEKGMNPKEWQKRPAPYPYRNLKWGLLMIGAGIGLSLAYFITQYVLQDHEDPALWFAFTGIGGGIGLVYSYKVEKKEVLDKQPEGR